MPAPLKCSINIKKLRKSWMKDHANGATYCDIIIFFNDEPDQYGNTVSLKQGMPKEAREAGEKAEYLGNGKPMERSGGQQTPRATRPPQQGPKSWDKPKPTGVPPTEGKWDPDSVPF